MAKKEHLDKLLQLLMRRPQRTATLLTELGVSQPTYSRLWTKVEGGIALGAGKARQYALERPIPGVTSPIPLFRVAANGQAQSIGNITPLHDGYYALTPPQGGAFRIFQGLPYFLRDLRPQGFLGRLEPGKHADLELPADILRWNDAHILKYISRRSEHAPGDLIVGNESYARYLADAVNVKKSVIPESGRGARYPGMAEHAMRGEPPGSSAGGEQPKFTAVVKRIGNRKIVEHVIVKFSPRVDTHSGRRWGDLLVCEHLAAEVLAGHDIAAARTSILEAGGRIFLEVVRFDRVGLSGRLPVATMAAFDGDVGMLDQNWTNVARELRRRGELAPKDVETVEILDLYGTLIGNTDKHHGNIALAWEFEKPHRLLPAYDMLPMVYRPNAHGEVIPREWTPKLGAGLELRHLALCYQMALRFWNRVLEDQRISSAFKQDVAIPHLERLKELGAFQWDG